jgi:hypothetical protein
MLGDIFASRRPQQLPPLPVAVIVLRSPLAHAATAANGGVPQLVVRSPLPFASAREIPPPPNVFCNLACFDLAMFSFVNFVVGLSAWMLPCWICAWFCSPNVVICAPWKTHPCLGVASFVVGLAGLVAIILGIFWDGGRGSKHTSGELHTSGEPFGKTRFAELCASVCNGSAQQQWNFTVSGHLESVDHRCISVDYDPYFDIYSLQYYYLELGACGVGLQAWTRKNTSLYLFADESDEGQQCITLGDDRYAVSLGSCTASPMQGWAFSNGLLISTLTGHCVSAANPEFQRRHRDPV